jgi:hypothetical protein
MEQDELLLYQKPASGVHLSGINVQLYAISGSIHWSFALRKSCSNKSGDDSNIQPTQNAVATKPQNGNTKALPNY